jgi:hypothetical protein
LIADYNTARLIALKEKLAHEKAHLEELEKTMYVVLDRTP